MRCPDPESLTQALARVAAGEEDEALDEHLATCPRCRQGALAVSQANQAAPQSTELGPGMVVGRYEILDLAGRGASSQVYRARDLELGRQVALKVITTKVALDGQARARLAHEAHALARLSHPNVATVYELVREGDRWCLAMEWVEGERLGIYAEAPGRKRNEILGVLRQVAHGLIAVHESGLIHGDVKPDNILVRPDGVAKLVDFGLAVHGTAAPIPLGSASGDGDEDDLAATRPALSGGAAGTPAYMAPELLLGRAADAASDQWAFCVSVVQLLAGVLPFSASNPDELRRRQLRPPDGVPRLPGWLRRVVSQGLALRPEARFLGMRQLERAMALRGRDRKLLLAAVIAAVGVLATWAVVVLTRPVHTLAADNPGYLLQLAVLEARANVRQDDATIAIARDLVDRAERDHAYSTAALACLRLGRVLISRGRFEEADDVLRRGLLLSERADDDGLRARLITAGMYNKMGERADLPGAHLLSQLADAVTSRLTTDPRSRARLLRAQGILADREGHGEEALRLLQAARDDARRGWGEGLDLVPYDIALARSHIAQAHHAEAIAAAERAIQPLEDMTPAERVQNLTDAVFVTVRAGAYARARQLMDRAHREVPQAFGDSWPLRRVSLGAHEVNILEAEGRTAEALALSSEVAEHTDALAMGTVAPVHQHVVTAILALEHGDLELARQHLASAHASGDNPSWPAHIQLSLRALDLLLGPPRPEARYLAVGYCFWLLRGGFVDPPFRTLAMLLATHAW